MKLKLIAFAFILSIILSSCSLLTPVETVSSDKGPQAQPTEGSGPSDSDSPKPTASADPSTSSVTTGTDVIPPEGPVIPTREKGAPLTVCIDAGHGYDDPGCIPEYFNGGNERDLVAQYALELKAKLEAQGCNVIMLHTPEKYVTAAEVAQAADKMGMTYKKESLVDDRRFAAYNRSIWANVLHRETFIDLFISLHVDYFGEEYVRGTRVYYCNEYAYAKESEIYCGDVVAALGETVPEMNPRMFPKGVKEALVVTKCTDMPSLLVEIGFASNREDAEAMQDEDWMDKFVSGLADGIITYGEKILPKQS